MIHRLAFQLALPASNVAEYQRRHDALWPELRAAITAQGGGNYSLFAAPAIDRVFGYVEVADIARWESGATTELTRRWWRYMADLMPSNPDGSPVGSPLTEVFHQD
jgi:L-rhamnose mutarotase